jgi:hypothetical protein
MRWIAIAACVYLFCAMLALGLMLADNARRTMRQDRPALLFTDHHE